MNKSELIDAIAADAGITKNAAKLALDSFLGNVGSTLKTGGKIYIADWGQERNKTKAKLISLFKYFKVLKYIVEHGKGLFPGYITRAGFKHVVETNYLKTTTGTLCYYQAGK